MEEGDGDGLGDAFWGVARRLRRTSFSALAPWDVTPSQLRALRTLHHHGQLRPGALAEHLRIAPRSATEVVDALQQRGLAERAPDPGDRRATLVTLTDEGVRVVDAVRAARAADAESLFATLSEPDRAELLRLLRAVLDSTSHTE
jgi:DNA-binding MarR family transcriptional regulator